MDKLGAVLTYHTNIRACGVAKFNHLLAAKLDIPTVKLFSPGSDTIQRPLISIKPSEFSAEDLIRLDNWMRNHHQKNSYSVFFHDYQDGAIERELVRKARFVYCANDEMAQTLRQLRSDVAQLWAPAMLIDPRVHEEAEITVFSFGMAHKLQATYYRKLKGLLENAGVKYRLFVSTALHEGFTFDDSFETAFREIEEIFPDRAYFLGFLSDSAVFNYLLESTFYAAFFPKAVRANNTTVHSAMEAGAVVITNLDAYSPSSYVHGNNILDINQLTAIPTEKTKISSISRSAIRTSVEFGWDSFARELTNKEQIWSAPTEHRPGILKPT
jgi:hypothetical protein